MRGGWRAAYLGQRTKEEELSQKRLVGDFGFALCPNEIASIWDGSTICAHDEIAGEGVNSWRLGQLIVIRLLRWTWLL